MFCLFFPPDLKVKCINYEKLVDSSKWQVRKLKFLKEWKIFQNLENVQNMWCNKAGDDCIHFHTDHSYIFSHPPAKYWKETDPNVNRDHSVISKKQHLTQTISLRDDFYQDNFRKHWDVSQDLSNLIFLTRKIEILVSNCCFHRRIFLISD